MTKRFLRVTFTALALFLMVAGSVNLRQANADVTCPGVGCPGGTRQCATINSNPSVTCYND
ncbi:MAG TPA: hypothetical protein VJT69_04465 [Pyrinomonadaceae bacterium]|jgi:hypothetical protein|nr:hypothetical protein [Pyrinomonadaceae bacterium]